MQQFGIVLSQSVGPACQHLVPFLIKILLLFFKKNQILSPDVFKNRNYSDLLRQKRSLEDISRNSNFKKSNVNFEKKNRSKKIEEENRVNDSKDPTIIKPDEEWKRSCRFIKPTGSGSKMRMLEADKVENIFCFIRSEMRNSASELLNVFKVADCFLERLTHFNLQGTLLLFVSFI